jgi:hypothetical protein
MTIHYNCKFPIAELYQFTLGEFLKEAIHGKAGN